MELTYLRTFREVAKSGSFTRAAEQLGYAQSSVTTQIQKLEDAYGAVLVERFGRRMRLTVAGEALLHYANDIIKLHDESREAVASQSKGTLSIGTIETMAAYYLPPYIQRYRQLFPDMKVLIQPGNEPAIIEAVKDGALDVGIILDTAFDDPELDVIRIREEELIIIAPPGHRISGMEEVTVEELAEESLILTEDGCTYRAMLLRELKRQQINYMLTYEFGNLEAIKQSVIYGLGIALLPRIVVQSELAQGKLAAAKFNDPACRFYTQLIVAKKKWRSHALQGFRQLITGAT
ncbi:DNA-binding transcriptional LysR family regulator [Paenibacillus phyllosphaerae]|uniref:DNA-binding transcriptional LysR family regulator n=1 Tax=Paenibacillus phyllosphaerae TaxID=274593 RepID=A0A7W5FMF2_9BACL|nr:LysR family transcriptional regulator [Paenibacillus phyllosphaerae]MBB3110068.1 DNA-binding transcriptional LysR family regulator [Paenibacillus phyllosphaerae]